MAVRIQTRTYLGNTHLHASARFSREAFGLEHANTNPPPGDVFTEHRSYVVASVIMAVAFLEATINQLFADAAEGHVEHLAGLDPRTLKLMADLWAQGIPRTARYSILAKYEVALSLASKAPFDRGVPPYQHAHALISLRNELVHYEPKWIPSDSTKLPHERHHIETLLRGRFPENPLTGAGNPFYPDKCLGHGCASWGVGTTVAFADAFFSRLGTKPYHDNVRGSIKTR